VRDQVANGGALELVELDLASLAKVRACADMLIAAGKPFDVVIANAGVMATPKGKTSDGFETQFGTNHLGHFVLVNRIASLLKPGARLVNLSSAGRRFSDVESQLRTRALYRVWRVRPLQDSQHTVRCGVRSPS
jgi:NAD(P)-dependent dehydrogenase (short-subunit alcohol dehydrogenase family)